MLAASAANAQHSNPYRAYYGWANLPEGRSLGVVAGIYQDPDGQHMWLMDRCGGNNCAGVDLDPILKLDLDGNLVTSFGKGLFGWPHGFFVDHEGNLWVTEGAPAGERRALTAHTEPKAATYTVKQRSKAQKSKSRQSRLQYPQQTRRHVSLVRFQDHVRRWPTGDALNCGRQRR